MSALFCVMLVGLRLMSQNIDFKPVTLSSDINTFKADLTRETDKIKDIKAEFTQTKKMEFLNEAVISTGTLYFSEGKRLRWEYEKPYSFLFILNGTKAWMINQGSTIEVDVHSNKMLKELSELMLFGIGGTSLFENRNFDFSFFNSGARWKVVLVPKSKEMKSLYKMVELIFATPSCQMESVRLMETSGDEMVIQLKNLQVNTQLPDDLFYGKR